MYWSTDWKPQPKVFLVFCSSCKSVTKSLKVGHDQFHMLSTVLSSQPFDVSALYKLEVNICTDLTSGVITPSLCSHFILHVQRKASILSCNNKGFM
jgi:hypothetical protein